MIGVCPPLLVGLRDGLGILFFSMAAFGSLCISVAVLLSVRKSGSWGSEGNFVFWGGVFLATAFLVSALQFVVVGQWDLVDPVVYLVVKWVLIVWVMTYLGWAVANCRWPRKKMNRIDPPAREDDSANMGGGVDGRSSW